MVRKIYHLLSVIVLISASQTFVSCTNEEENETPKEILLNGEKLEISVGEEAFVQPASMRATAEMKDSTVDLGNGIVAEMSMKADRTAPTTTAAATRATTMSDGHYTIYILDASGNRLMGTDKELSGTVTGGNFVPDHHASIKLPNGTYTFVCHNDAVVAQGNNLKITNSSITTTCPMIGVVTKTLGSGTTHISFTLKHYAARVRTEITTYTAYAEMDNNNTTFSSVSNGLTELSLSLKGDAPSRATSGSMMYTEASAKQFENVGAQAYSSVVKPFKTNGNYVYIPLAPGENIPVNDLKYNFNGKIYGKPINHTFLNKAQFNPNYSYSITLTFKSKDPLLLFQDGTVGYKGDKTPARMPIGVVTVEKTSDTEGTAIALKDTPVPTIQYIQSVSASYLLPYTDQEEGKLFSRNSDGYFFTYGLIYEDGTSFKDYLEGNNLQFPPSVPMSQYVLGYEAMFPMQRDVTGYNPGVPTQNVGKWFIATGSQWRDAFSRLAKIDETEFFRLDTDEQNVEYGQSYYNNNSFMPPTPNTTIRWQDEKINEIFMGLDGDSLKGLYNVAGGFTKLGNRVHYLFIREDAICPTWTQDGNLYPARIRPFVHF